MALSGGNCPGGLLTTHRPVGSRQGTPYGVAVSVLGMRGVGVRRGTRWILRDVTWTVLPQQHWVVIGANGAGKSTLMDVAAARSFPSVGDVTALDEVLGAVDLAELRPRIGFASSVVAHYIDDAEHAFDVVRTAAHGMSGSWQESYDPEDDLRARDLLRRWGVESLAEKEFARMSEGERKRVLIARALMTDPELLILDEPGASLDLAGREDLVARLDKFAKSIDSPSMVLVTHHVEEIPPSFTHALVLKDGAVLAQGVIDQVMTSPVLSEAFSMPLSVQRTEGRYTARSVTS